MAAPIKTEIMAAPSYETRILDHLGLVAGMYEELGIGEVSDRAVLQDKEKRLVAVGQVVKAMVPNGLGLVNQRLYRMPPFSQDKSTERLIGAGIGPEHLNDDITIEPWRGCMSRRSRAWMPGFLRRWLNG